MLSTAFVTRPGSARRGQLESQLVVLPRLQIELPLVAMRPHGQSRYLRDLIVRRGCRRRIPLIPMPQRFPQS